MKISRLALGLAALTFATSASAQFRVYVNDFLNIGAGARGLATGRMFTEDGRNIGTAVQEGLLRGVGR